MASRPRPGSPVASTAFYAPSALLLLCGLFAGCARSLAPAPQPTAGAPVSAEPSSAAEQQAESAPRTLEEAEAELEQARLALAQTGGNLSAPAGAAAPPSPSPAAAPTLDEKKRATSDGAPKAHRAEKAADQAEAESSARDDNRCATTCKAYASLLRAKSAVCRLDVPNGARCARAEGIVRDATPQVQSCQCAS